MYIKIHKPTDYASNKGSSSDLIQYLEKENINLNSMDEERFFNHDSDRISALMAQSKLDNHHYKLGKNDTKFYMMSISPSEKELQHIGNDKQKMKDYVRDVMDKYAEKFNRVYKNGEKLQGKDLVYYAKIENSRTYAYDEEKYKEELSHNKRIEKQINQIKKDMINPSLSKRDKRKLEKEIQKNELKYIRNKKSVVIKAGNQKDGLHTHVHVVIHRYDKQQKFKLSPLATARNTKKKRGSIR